MHNIIMSIIVFIYHFYLLSFNVFLILSLRTCSSSEALASRSSRSGNNNNNNHKKSSASTSKGGSGFDNNRLADNKLPSTTNKSTYTRDTSPVIHDLISFLVEEECEGIGGGEKGEDGVNCCTEVGYCIRTGRRGLFATDSFQQGELISGIPFPACITLAMDDISVKEANDAELGLRLIRLLAEGRESKFWPYFQTLPTEDSQHFDATPDFWSMKQIENLEIPTIVKQAKERNQLIQQLADENDDPSVDVSGLQFATWLVKSRGFTLLKPILKERSTDVSDENNHFSVVDNSASADAKQPQPPTPQTAIISKTVLMPYFDMINHESSDRANAELQVLETKREDESFYALQAIRPISKGSEITISYGTGQENSLHLLSNYGFLQSTINPYDAIFMKEEYNDDFAWSTTLEQDEKLLQELFTITSGKTKNDDEVIMKTILEFRIKMKHAAMKKGL